MILFHDVAFTVLAREPAKHYYELVAFGARGVLGVGLVKGGSSFVASG
jgi:hypothetical protein